MNKPIVAVTAGVMICMGCSGTIPELGANNGRLLPCPQTPNCVNSQASDEKHLIEPLHYIGTRTEAQNRLLKIIRSEPRTKILKVQDDYIRATFTSAIFRFVDDVEFYFTEPQGDETVVHIRSASRVGYSDLGANQKRIERIRRKFK